MSGTRRCATMVQPIITLSHLIQSPYLQAPLVMIGSHLSWRSTRAAESPILLFYLTATYFRVASVGQSSTYPLNGHALRPWNRETLKPPDTNLPTHPPPSPAWPESSRFGLPHLWIGCLFASGILGFLDFWILDSMTLVFLDSLVSLHSGLSGWLPVFDHHLLSHTVHSRRFHICLHPFRLTRV